MATEQWLIDLDEAIDALGVEYEHIKCKYFLEERPIVDAVEVVRCKDCKLDASELDKEPHCSLFCGLHSKSYATKPDDFCSYGERRTDGTAQV